MNKKGFFGMMALFVGVMLVSGGGQVFAQQVTWKQNFIEFRNLKVIDLFGYWEDIQFIKVTGTGDPRVIEMRDGRMVKPDEVAKKGSGNQKYDVRKIKTGPSQYVEFVAWNHTTEWNSPYARHVCFYQVQPKSEIVFADHGKKFSFDFQLKSGSIKYDANVPRTGEALHFIDLVMGAMKNRDKIKKKVDGLKISDTAERVAKVISNGVGNAGWFGALTGSLGLYAQPADLVVQKKYMIKAELAYAIACAYGKTRTDKQFERDLLYLFSGMTVEEGQVEAVQNMVGNALEDLAWKGAEEISKQVFSKAAGEIAGQAIPLVSMGIGGIKDGWKDSKEAKDFAERARKFYAPKRRG